MKSETGSFQKKRKSSPRSNSTRFVFKMECDHETPFYDIRIKGGISRKDVPFPWSKVISWIRWIVGIITSYLTCEQLPQGSVNKIKICGEFWQKSEVFTCAKYKKPSPFSPSAWNTETYFA